MSKQYSKLADSSDALMIKEAIEKLSNVSLSPDIGDSIAELAKELREARIQREGEIEKMVQGLSTPPPPPAVDVKEIILGLQQANVERPSYQFKVQRDHNGVMIGIQATPF